MNTKNRLVGLLVLVAAGVAVLKFRSATEMTSESVDLAMVDLAKARGSQRRDVSSDEVPFWNRARVPSVDWSLPDAPEIRLEIEPKPPLDYRRELERLLANRELPRLNGMLAEWFERDPAAARDWLAERESLTPYQTAIALIAGNMATAGDVGNALQWAEVLQQGDQRQQAIFDVYVVGARQRLFTVEQLQAAPLPEPQRQQLISGVAGD